MNELPEVGTKWRRKANGLLVGVTRTDGYFSDVYWREIGGTKKGVAWVGNFAKAYEPADDDAPR